MGPGVEKKSRKKKKKEKKITWVLWKVAWAIGAGAAATVAIVQSI
jgi:hypothetical protein